MPEGHLLHRLARDQQELVGEELSASSPQGRFAYGAAELDRRSLLGVEAYGKHLHHRFAGERSVHVHLGMQGKWLRLLSTPPRPQVRLRLATLAVAWDLIAPSACTLIDDAGWSELVGRLGPDPLRAGADAGRAYEALTASTGTVGAAVVDQTVIAGVGNVLRAEGLFLAGIHPSRPASSIDRPSFDRLWRVLTGLMRQSVEDGRILSAPLPAGTRATARESEARMVYKQAECRACGTAVEVFTLAGRTAYACPACQPG
ncbi:MAG TPA: DNA-formamidopyrimidine glycosylase family protein [Acidimicrobiales bacterium]|nr:DNA-formamidopyrimidine glycosylase family protein [Acidimicrobiales bacterium]